MPVGGTQCRVAVAVVFGLLFGLALAPMAGCSLSPGASVVRVGTQPAIFAAPYFIAREAGYFDQARLDVKETSFINDAAVSEALLGGKVDVAYLGAAPALIAAVASRDIAIIAVSDRSDGATGLVARYGAKIAAPPDLKGKRIGVVKGSNAHRFLLEVLAGAGLNPDTDVKLQDIAPEDQVIALQSKNLDAAATGEPYLTRACQAGASILIDDAKAGSVTYDVIAARRDYLKRRPKAVQAFLDGHFRGAAYKACDPAAAAEMVARCLALKAGDVELALRLYAHPDLIAELGPDFLGPPDEKARGDIIQQAVSLVQRGLIAAPPDPEALFDVSFIRAMGAER